MDFKLHFYESSFQVAKGKLLCCYQPLAMGTRWSSRTPNVFLPNWFIEDKELLKYLFWSNGPDHEAYDRQQSVYNQGPRRGDGTACMIVAHIFNQFDTFECDDSGCPLPSSRRQFRKCNKPCNGGKREEE